MAREKVVSLSPVKRDDKGGFPEVVALLEELLVQARAGEIESFGIIMTRPNRSVSTQLTPTTEAHLLLAGTVYLQPDIVQRSSSK